MPDVGYQLLKDLIPIKNCLKKKENGNFLIVSNDNQEIFYLNETAKEIFEKCTGTMSISEIYAYFKSQYEVSEDELQRDIVALIRDFQWQDIISLKEIII